MNALSGTQVTLTHGDQVATVATVGAALREYRVGDRDVIVPFGADEVAPASHGMVLIPWPNRLADGAYEFGGRELQVPVSEPGRRTALHGLACWESWDITEASDDAVTLTLDLPAQPGYPFALTVDVEYRLTDTGLVVTTEASNQGGEALPYGVGFHPWISPGDAAVSECTLALGASAHVEVDDRLLPTGTAPVGDDTDFREATLLEGVSLDDAWTEPVRDAEGLAWAHLVAPDGSAVSVWMDGAAKAWQVCTGDGLNPPEIRRTGVAIEPMSCIADAFRTGDDLVVLKPGDTHRIVWGMRLTTGGDTGYGVTK